MNVMTKTCLIGVGSLMLAACGSDNGPEIVAPPPADTAAPQISVEDQQIFADSLANRIVLSITDDRTATADISVSVTSSNQHILRDEELLLASNAGEFSLTVTPQPDIVGATRIQVTATDAAQNTAEQIFTVDVQANAISARSFFGELQSTGADQEPAFINGIELIEDIESDAIFDDLFLQ